MSTINDLPDGWVRLRDSTRWRWALGGGIEAEAAFWGPGNSYAEFLRVVGGMEQTITYPDGSGVTRIVPLKFPSNSPDFEDVYAVDCELTGAGRPSEDANEQIVYEWARARVLFRTQPFYNFGGDYPLVSYSYTSGADFITRPGTAYVFPSDSLRLNQDVGVLVPFRDFQVTFHNLTSPNEELYESLTGRVNSATFRLPNGRSYDAGFIQYFGPAGQYQQTIGNQRNWTVSHRFKLRYIKHNEIMRPDGTAFEAPEDDTGANIIPEADLMQLYSY